MRLARPVAAGLVLGAVIGFVAALLRPGGDSAASGPQAQAAASGGADVPTRPFPLPIQPELSGTGGVH